jgi:ligand-binding sensor domain-containing protein
LSSFTRLVSFLALLAIFAAIGCEEDPDPVVPEPPPQISVRNHFTRNSNPADTVTGLQNNDAYDVLVDSQGRTWIATQSGVSRFVGGSGDGVFNERTTLPNPKCRALLEFNGKIWIATSGGGAGVYNIADDTWSILDSDSGMINNNLNGVTGHTNGTTVYFATSNGASIYRDLPDVPMNERWRAFRPAQGLLDPVVSVIEIAQTQTRGREIWYGPRFEEMLEPEDEGNHGITVQRQGLSQPIEYTILNSGLLEPNVNDIFYDADTDLFWVAFATKGIAIVDVDGSSWSYLNQQDGLPSNIVYSITKVGDEIWVGTQAGVARRLSNGKFRGYARAGGLPADRVRRVYSDDPSNLWCAFIDGGAALLDPASAQ